jgi:OHCU decarboxylase
MRSDPEDFEMVAAKSLQQAVTFLAREPGAWLPIAGGTDVMVLYGAGALRARKLMSIWNLRELRGITETPAELVIGAGCTYTDLRRDAVIAREFPLLARAASWTGGIANQNRGTLGGNIANASPAADSLPALLAYDAELTLASVRGERRVAYREFHLGYKKTAMAADELIRGICLARKYSEYFSYARKVGARRAQAIAKISVAGLGLVTDGVMRDVRIALGSVAPVPVRLRKLEAALNGNTCDAIPAEELRRFVAEEIAPIADIRSSAEYRSAVAGNLVAEFVEQLCASEVRQRSADVNDLLARWNALEREEAAREILPCCGARAWADGMARRRPFGGVAELLEAAREVWRGLTAADWMEAFRSHPRIGESRAAGAATAKSRQWSSEEQQKVTAGDEEVKAALAAGNRSYEERFGRVFIVCATGKSPNEILQILRRRLQNDEASEMREAADEQQQITRLRLRKWLGE